LEKERAMSPEEQYECSDEEIFTSMRASASDIREIIRRTLTVIEQTQIILREPERPTRARMPHEPFAAHEPTPRQYHIVATEQQPAVRSAESLRRENKLLHDANKSLQAEAKLLRAENMSLHAENKSLHAENKPLQEQLSQARAAAEPGQFGSPNEEVTKLNKQVAKDELRALVAECLVKNNMNTYRAMEEFKQIVSKRPDLLEIVVQRFDHVLLVNPGLWSINDPPDKLPQA
jgi:hypothetical protein